MRVCEQVNKQVSSLAKKAVRSSYSIMLATIDMSTGVSHWFIEAPTGRRLGGKVWYFIFTFLSSLPSPTVSDNCIVGHITAGLEIVRISV